MHITSVNTTSAFIATLVQKAGRKLYSLGPSPKWTLSSTLVVLMIVLQFWEKEEK